MTISEERGELTRTFGAQSRADDNDVIQLFWPFADFIQPIDTKNLARIILACMHSAASKELPKVPYDIDG